MASFSSTGWAPGATVTAYVRGPRGEQTGSSVASGTADTNGAVTFSGLNDTTGYVATDGTRTVNFRTPAGGPSSGSPFVPPRGGVARHFPLSTIWASNGKYVAFGTACRCADGSILAVARRGDTHALDQGSLIAKRSWDGGVTWPPDTAEWTVASSATAGVGTSDLRDPCLLREPGKTRVWLSYFLNQIGGTGPRGIYLCYSDDHGSTFSTPILARATDFTGVSPRWFASLNKWAWPIYTSSQCRLMTADQLAGPWTDTGVLVFAGTEWDCIEVPSGGTTSLVGICRATGGAQASAVQSTDGGATWTAQILDIVSSLKYDGWPTLRRGSDGRVLDFQRGTLGQRLLQLLDIANPLTAANWREPGVNGGNWGGYPGAVSALDGTPSPHTNWFMGKYQPWREGDVWMGAYMAELNDAQTNAEMRFGAFNEREILGGYSFVSTSETTAALTAGTPGLLPTPDRVTVRVPAGGGRYRITAKTRSSQPSGTLQNWSISVYDNGTVIPTTQLDNFIRSASETVVAVQYPDLIDGVVELTGGVHVIELRVMQSNSVAVPRSFAGRSLVVRPA